MATSTAHPSFPSRPYTSGLGRPATTQPQNTYNAPQQNPFPSQPYNAAQGGFGTNATQQRDAQRLERERQERAERERAAREAEERGVLEALSEEQREEINEAVRHIHAPALKGANAAVRETLRERCIQLTYGAKVRIV